MKRNKRGEERRMPFDIILMNSLIAGREGGRFALRNYQGIARRASAEVISEKQPDSTLSGSGITICVSSRQ